MSLTKDADELFSADQFDIRDVIARFEELEANGEKDEYEIVEQARLIEMLDEVKGNGGDEEWRGAWYPVGFTADSHFEDMARELAEDIGAIQRNATWPNNHIDWTAAAEALQQDYTSIEIGGVTYWYR